MTIAHVREHWRKDLRQERPGARDSKRADVACPRSAREEIHCVEHAGGEVSCAFARLRDSHGRAAAFDERGADMVGKALHPAPEHADVERELVRGAREGAGGSTIDMGGENREGAQVLEEVAGVRHDASIASKVGRRCLVCTIAAQQDAVMGRRRVPSSFFVFVVVECRGHVLLVRERKHGQLWYAPAGGLEPGESIVEAAVRETMEEAGIAVVPTSLLRVDQEWHPGESGLAGWWRFVLRARPVGSLEPKRVADEHSLEARWVRPADIPSYPLRHAEVIDLVAVALDPENAGVPTGPMVIRRSA